MIFQLETWKQADFCISVTLKKYLLLDNMVSYNKE